MTEGPPDGGCVQAISDDVSLYESNTKIVAIVSLVLFVVFAIAIVYSVILKRLDDKAKEEPPAFKKLIEEHQ